MNLEIPVKKTAVNHADKFCAIIKDKCKGDACAFWWQDQCSFVTALGNIRTMELRLDRIAQLMGKSGGVSS
jgi:hypothetical protein